jgi:endo-1,4-beta-xylanase
MRQPHPTDDVPLLLAIFVLTVAFVTACISSEGLGPNLTGGAGGHEDPANGGSSGGPAGTGGGGAGGSGGTTGNDGGRVDASPGGAGGAAVDAREAGAGDAAGTGGVGGMPPPLKKFVGNIDTRGQVRSDFLMYWDQLSPENAGKWGSVEGVRNQMNWTTLDRFYAFAKQNNIPFKEHNFIWGAQQPSWLAGLSQADQRAEVEEWIRLYCQRYPDTALIDVVNEPPPHTTPVYMAALGGAGASGYDWIVQAFNWAHQYCPNSILILNDYNTIELAGDNTRMITMVKAIKAAGAPIHGIGAQAHGASGMATAIVQMYIDKLATQTGVPVYITEYDINVADDAKQASIMQSQFTMFWNDDNVKGITLWGYVVGSTWETNSGLMTSSGTMRPAMTWLMGFLGR